MCSGNGVEYMLQGTASCLSIDMKWIYIEMRENMIFAVF